MSEKRGFKDGRADGKKAERARWNTVLNAPECKGHQKIAVKILRESPDLSATAAIALLAPLGSDTTPPSSKENALQRFLRGGNIH